MKKLLPLATVLFASTGFAQGIEIPRPTTGYSATQTVQVGSFSMAMDIAYEEGKQRSTTNMMGQQMYTIIRQDLELVWIGMPGGMYMEQPFGEEVAVPGQQERVPSFSEFQDAVLFEEEGRETIDGRATTRYHYIVNDPSSGGQVDGRAWLTDENIPVQLVMTTEMNGQPAEIRMTLSNLNTGNQPDELFELPPGAQKFSMGGLPGFGGGGGGLFGGGASAPAAPASEDESTLTGEITDAAADGAREAAVDEARDTAGDAVRGGFRRLRDALRN